MTASQPRPIVGIDVGKRTCHIHIVNPETEPEAFTAPRLDVAALLLQQLPANVPAIIALELTGNLALPILEALECSPHQLMIAQHTDSAALRTITRRRRKTDTLDAALIAELATLLTNPDTAPMIGATLTPWPAMRSAILTRRTVRSLQALVSDRQRQRLRAKSINDPLALEHAAQQIALITAQIATTEATMLANAGDDERLLSTIPGVTLRRACVLTAAIGDIQRFNNRNQLVKYLGLVPPHRPQSGVATGRAKRQRSTDLLTTELFMYGLWVAGNLPKAGPIGQTYQRIKARTGSGRTAMWAARRHLIRICWSILTSRQPYGNPETRREDTPPAVGALPRALDEPDHLPPSA